MRVFLITFTALAIYPQTSRDVTEVLAHTRDNMIERTKRLLDYTCVQTVDRQYYVRSKPEQPRPSCDQMSAEARKKSYTLRLTATDRLHLDVKVSAGTEIGSWAGANRFDSRSILDLVGGGPFGTGPFGPLLQDVFVNGGTTFRYVGEEQGNNPALFHYRFQVPVGASHFLVRNGEARDWTATSYDGDLWIDPDSFDLRRISVRTSELSPETNACETAMTADYARVRFQTGDFLIPQHSVFHILMRDTQETEITYSYSSCREYRGESTLSFADPPTKSAREGKTSRVPKSLPAGLSVTLAFTAPIDTDTAAAGDIVAAKVRKAIRDPRSKEVLIPAGVTVQGRIIEMRHWVTAPAYFLIAILLETVDINGVSSPFYAQLDRPDEYMDEQRTKSGFHPPGVAIILPPAGRSTSVGSFVFRTTNRRYVVPSNYESNWTTIPPPNQGTPPSR
jgi:hypothetical protein